MTLFRLVIVASLAGMALPAAAGDITGVIHYSGAPPNLQPFQATRDQKVCGQTVPNESVEVTDGHLSNVVVTVEGGSVSKPPKETITIDQKNCRYHPHVQAAPVGSTLEIINSDPMLHNIHGYLGQRTLFNLAMPIKGQKIPRPLPQAGLVSIKCDVHSWMQGYVVVTDHPFAVDKEDGSYAIKSLPAGTYTVSAWHEKLGKKTEKVTVPATGEAHVDFTFSGPAVAAHR